MSLLHLRIAGAILVLASLFGAYKWIGSRAVSLYKVELAIEQAEADKAQTDKFNAVSAELEAAKAVRIDNARVITKVVEKIVTRDVYLRDCIDGDGLSVANQALSGGSATKSDAALPATK
jgi:hypothetical protein